MHRLYYQPEGSWFGDCMPFGKDGTFYLYHQRDFRNPGPLPDCEPFGWDLTLTDDFVHYMDMGTAIPTGETDAQDQFVFAGSVFEGEGQYHAFYTGYNRDYSALGKASQVLMHATSQDLFHWKKSQDKLMITPQPGYDPTDWRDPFVLWDEEDGQYLLILGARKEGDKNQLTGRTVSFTSKDLKHWEFQGDFWAPGLFTMHEMPDLFRMGDWWYLITTEYSHSCKMIYRMSKSLKGPWVAPKDDAFDGRAYYAGRSFCQNGHRILFGWVPTRAYENDRSEFVWGGTYMAHEIYQRPDHTLGVKPPDTVWNAFTGRRRLDPCRLCGISSQTSTVLVRETSQHYSFEADLTFSQGTRNFGLQLYRDETSGRCYQYTFSVLENHFQFDKVPNWPWPAIANGGLKRPIFLQSGSIYHIRLIVDNTIATLYVNGVALNARMYERPGSVLGISVNEGDVKLESMTFSNLIVK